MSGYPAAKLETLMGSDPNLGFLAKPFDLDALAAEVRRLVRR